MEHLLTIKLPLSSLIHLDYAFYKFCLFPSDLTVPTHQSIHCYEVPPKVLQFFDHNFIQISKQVCAEDTIKLVKGGRGEESLSTPKSHQPTFYCSDLLKPCSVR